jgi:ubiquinone/menaquinone biosynthesis C-methylase UbiE
MSSWQKKRRMMRRYDITAEIYDARYAEEQAAKIEAALKRVEIENYDGVLDSGCGTGILFDYAADKAKLIVGIDISKKTLLQAIRHVKRKSLSNVHLIQADMDNLPFGDGVFSRVFSLTVLQNSPEYSETLAEIKRTGTNDAIFVVTGLKSIFSKRVFERLLSKSQLKIVAFEEENLKCYVAICANSALFKSPFGSDSSDTHTKRERLRTRHLQKDTMKRSFGRRRHAQV